MQIDVNKGIYSDDDGTGERTCNYYVLKQDGNMYLVFEQAEGVKAISLASKIHRLVESVARREGISSNDCKVFECYPPHWNHKEVWGHSDVVAVEITGGDRITYAPSKEDISLIKQYCR
jgi:hypothetical protein